jgi:AcrR family transcriptional regulator
MSVGKRPYIKKRRAELEARTRLRITESAMELHGTLGPSRTSVSAVAERAGVRRSTVYRHFPDEAALFAACTSHWMTSNPVPDIGRWASIGDPQERLQTALRELYRHYRKTEQMMDLILRDERSMPIVEQMLGGFRGYIAAARDVLMDGRQAQGRRRGLERAALGHALAFATWQSLAREQGLSDSKAAELMCCLVSCSSGHSASR